MKQLKNVIHYYLPYKVIFIFAWYDFWVGLFYDKKKNCLYIFPIPMIGVLLMFCHKCEDCKKRDESVIVRYGGAVQCSKCLKDELDFEEDYSLGLIESNQAIKKEQTKQEDSSNYDPPHDFSEPIKGEIE